MDASGFEGATIVHDLDQPVPDELHEKFDCVIDGGTLEHVFQFPIAIKSVMQMTKVGGHLILSVPANNFMGHGFYQFSPELLFRVLAAENGFRILRFVAQEFELAFTSLIRCPIVEEFAGPFFDVTDPALTQRRVEIRSQRPTVLYVIAQRMEKKPIFASMPKQSDYSTRWASAVAGILQPAKPSPRTWRQFGRKWARFAVPERYRAGIKFRLVRWLKRPAAAWALVRQRRNMALPRTCKRVGQKRFP